MKKCAIFDLDGTLTNTLESLWMATSLSLRDASLYEPPLDDYRYFVGDGADEQIRRALRASGDEQLTHYEYVRSRYNVHFEKYVNYHVKPYEGIKDLLAELKNRGLYIAVNTNKPELRAIDVVKEQFGENTFDMVVGNVSDRPRKPAPDGAKYILDSLGVSAEDALYIGDTAVDMQTGKAAGLFTVGALWGFRDFEELSSGKADAIINSPMDLLSYI